MRRALALAAVLVLAGCSGGGGSAPGASPGTGTADAGQSPGAGTVTSESAGGGSTGGQSTGTGAADQPSTAAAEVRPGGHPAVEDGSLNVSRLVRGHLVALSRSDSFLLANNQSGTYAGNDSDAGRWVVVNRVDLEEPRQRLVRRAVDGNGATRVDELRYTNATTTCLAGEEVRCRSGGFDRQRVLGMAMETTSLETVLGPAFAPDGTVTRDGAPRYRYTASSFVDDLPSGTLDELGPDPVLREATLLVAPDGHIAEYAITYERGTGDDRLVLTAVYAVRGLNETAVRRPAVLDEG